MSTLLVVLLIGATLRITRLLTVDAIFETPRSWLERKLPEGVAYMLRCDWCMSMYVGIAVFTLAWYAPSTPVWIAAGALAASLIAGWAAVADSAIVDLVWGESTVTISEEMTIEDLTDGE